MRAVPCTRDFQNGFQPPSTAVAGSRLLQSLRTPADFAAVPRKKRFSNLWATLERVTLLSVYFAGLRAKVALRRLPKSAPPRSGCPVRADLGRFWCPCAPAVSSAGLCQEGVAHAVAVIVLSNDLSRRVDSQREGSGGAGEIHRSGSCRGYSGIRGTRN